MKTDRRLPIALRDQWPVIVHRPSDPRRAIRRAKEIKQETPDQAEQRRLHRAMLQELSYRFVGFLAGDALTVVDRYGRPVTGLRDGDHITTGPEFERPEGYEPPKPDLPAIEPTYRLEIDRP